MNVLDRLLRWLPGGRTLDAKKAELDQSAQRLQEILDQNRRSQHRLIQRMNRDSRWSERAVNTAQDALRIAKRAKCIVDDEIS